MSGIQLLVLSGKGKIPAPVNTAAPAVSGTVLVGNALSSTTGSWTGQVNTYTYQWQRGGATYSNISGATSSTYTLTSADRGYLIRCQVTAVGPDASTSATSSSTVVVPGQNEFSGYSGTTTWTCPPGVTSVSVVTIAMGGYTASIGNSVTPGIGGGGAALAYKNNISVTAGQNYTVYYALSSGGRYFANFNNSVYAESGVLGGYDNQAGRAASSLGDATYSGGTGGGNGAAAGGGAGGYSGNGGNGGNQSSAGQSGAGGGGGGGGGAAQYYWRGGSGGGGVSLYGAGANGAGGSAFAGGQGGSGGSSGGAASPYGGASGGSYGGGGGGGGAGYDYDPYPGSAGSGGAAGIRIMWGANRSYPSQNVSDQ
jgi:hypothetical protein